MSTIDVAKSAIQRLQAGAVAAELSGHARGTPGNASYHEAGHAVVALAVRGGEEEPVAHRAWIAENADGSVEGCCEFAPDVTFEERTSARTDDEKIEAILAALRVEPAIPPPDLGELRLDVEVILRRHWRAVEAMAASLLETGGLTQRQIEDAIRHTVPGLLPEYGG